MIIATIFYFLLFSIHVGLIAKKRFHAIYFLPIFILILEIAKNVFYEFGIEKGFNGWQIGILLVYTFYFIYKYPRKMLFYNIFIALFLAFTLFRISFFIDILSLGTRYFTMFFLLLLIPASFYVSRTTENLRVLNRSIIVCMIIFLVFSVISSVLQFGLNMYNTGVIYGLAHDQVNGPAVSVLLLPLIIPLLDSKLKKVLVLGLAAAIVIILILSLKRTPLIIIALGYMIFVLLSRTGARKILLIIPLVVVGYVGLSLVTKYSLERQKFRVNFDIGKEGRYIETQLVLELLSKDTMTLLLGTGELYDSRGKYNFTKYYDRPIHSSHIEILHGAGFVGLFLFVLILLSLLTRGHWLYKQTNQDTMSSILYAMYVALLVTLVPISISGGIRTVTTGIVFIYLGTLLGVLWNLRVNDVQVVPEISQRRLILKKEVFLDQ